MASPAVSKMSPRRAEVAYGTVYNGAASGASTDYDIILTPGMYSIGLLINGNPSAGTVAASVLDSQGTAITGSVFLMTGNAATATVNLATVTNAIASVIQTNGTVIGAIYAIPVYGILRITIAGSGAATGNIRIDYVAQRIGG